jgi:DNA-binding transcriptional LysR family regulator
MHRDDLVDLNAFYTVAQENSFTRAAAKLGTSQSALSHAIRRLESRHGVRLLTRTTRSVAPTDAGERLLQTLRPALEGLASELVSLKDLRDKPAGNIRITTSGHAATTLLWPAFERLLPGYPDLNIELNIYSGFTDIVAERYDAGVRLGEAIAKDMIAVRIGPDLRMAVVGSPAYFKDRAAPKSPHDLSSHRCINLRMLSSGGFYAWELEKNGRQVRVRVEGQLAFNSNQMVVRAALGGGGLGFVMEDQVLEHIAKGRLIRVLEDWCPPFSGYHLYYPSRRQNSAAFSLLVDALRYRGKPAAKPKKK